MTDLKKALARLLYPPAWVTALLTLLTTLSLLLVFLEGLEEHPVAYVVYMVAFYTLSVICIRGWRIIPTYYKRAKKRILNTKYGNRYMTDMTFRAHFLLYLSLGVNLLYIATNVLAGFLSGSMWFWIFAGYYTILASMRFILLRFFNRNEVGSDLLSEWRRARVCASILTLINLVLSGTILMMMYQDRGFRYPGILIYVMAGYSFYITTHAIESIIKYRRLGSPVMTTSKVISLAAALVSMLALETAMFSAFGNETPPETKRLMIALTGAGISVILLAISSYMIIRSTREIGKIKTEMKKNG